MESEQSGQVELAPYTFSVEKNSRGFTWSVKVRADSINIAELRLRQSMDLVRVAIKDFEAENENTPLPE